MPTIAIVTDSTADLPAELCTRNGITVIPHIVHFDDVALRDGVDIGSSAFFDRLALAGTKPDTSHPSQATFETTFRTLLEEVDQIVAIFISSKLSGTIATATGAATACSPERIEIVDSYNASLGLGFQVLHAAELVAHGLSAEQIAERLRTNVDAYHLVFFADTLDYLEQGGRIARSTSLVSNLLHLKPIVRIDEGQIVPFETARTKARAVAQLESFVTSWPSAITRLGVLYTTDREAAERLAGEFGDFSVDEPVVIAPLSPVLGVHVGPGAMGICLAEPELR
jgi:DegV family protein with EDD domain